MAGEVIVPGAEWRPNPISQQFIALRWIILHTIVGTVSSALPGRHYHIYVRANGTFVQIQDLRKRSAASKDANPYSIAIVCEDKGPAFPAWSGSNVPSYTPQQVNTLIYLISWICARFGLTTEAVRTSRPDDAPGVGHHRLGIDGNYPDHYPYWGRQPGGQNWSLTVGKACPGDNRIDQIVGQILPAVNNPEEEDVKPVPAAKLYTAYHSVVTQGGTPVPAKITRLIDRPDEFHYKLLQGTSSSGDQVHLCKATLQASGGVLDVVMPPNTAFPGSVWDIVAGGWGGPNDEFDQRAVALVWTVSGGGYWIVSDKGGIFTFGNAAPFAGNSPWGQATVGAWRNAHNKIVASLANGQIREST